MSTVGIAQARTVREHNGVYPGDEHLPPIVKIIEYDNAWGGLGYGLVYSGKPNVYTPSEFVRNPRVWWSIKT